MICIISRVHHSINMYTKDFGRHIDPAAPAQRTLVACLYDCPRDSSTSSTHNIMSITGCWDDVTLVMVTTAPLATLR